MPALIQTILDILGALPAVISAVLKILAAIKGQPSAVRAEAVSKGVQAMRDHIGGIEGPSDTKSL